MNANGFIQFQIMEARLRAMGSGLLKLKNVRYPTLLKGCKLVIGGRFHCFGTNEQNMEEISGFGKACSDIGCNPSQNDCSTSQRDKA